MSRSGLARAAGLHANSLRRMDEPDWNPTAGTLGKLETYLLKREGGTALASPEEIINERSEEHTSELQSLMRISYAVFCLKKKKDKQRKHIIQRKRTNIR